MPERLKLPQGKTVALDLSKVYNLTRQAQQDHTPNPLPKSTFRTCDFVRLADIR